VFQVPTYSRGYRFSVREYLERARPEAEMEMHVLPQPAIFALAREVGLEPVEVRDDACVLANPAASISNLFVFRRPG
jgi:hypothetical protein